MRLAFALGGALIALLLGCAIFFMYTREIPTRRADCDRTFFVPVVEGRVAVLTEEGLEPGEVTRQVKVRACVMS